MQRSRSRDIPFVRMRDGLDGDLLEGRASFSSVVADAQRAMPPVRLALKPARREVIAGGEALVMSPRQFAFYWMLAERALKRLPGFHWSEEGAGRELLSYYARLVGEHSGEYERSEEAFRHGLTGENINPDKAHVNGELKRMLGRRQAAPYVIAKGERIPGTRYYRIGLTLAPKEIEVCGDRVALAGGRERLRAANPT